HPRLRHGRDREQRRERAAQHRQRIANNRSLHASLPSEQSSTRMAMRGRLPDRWSPPDGLVREDPQSLGVLLTIVAIAVAASAGVLAERRWPARAVGWARRLLVLSLYTLVPFIVFFNLDRAHITADVAGGLLIGWIAILAAAGLAWLVSLRLLEL